MQLDFWGACLLLCTLAEEITLEQQTEKSQRFLNGIASVTQILQIALIKNDYAESQGMTPRVQIQHNCS